MATTTAIGNDATDLGSILQSAMAGSYVANGAGQSFTVSKTIVIYVNSTTQGPLGLDLGGGTIYSNITDGSPVIQVVVGPGVDLRYLTFANLTIQGNGHEGAGIQIIAGGNDRWVYNFGIENVTVNHVGGYGLDIEGSVFEGLVSNSWMTNNAKGGAYFSHLVDGQASALHWFGGGFQNNGGAGLMLDNGVRDMSVDGAKFIGNAGGGISAGNGITSVSNSDFQDNHGQGVWFQNYGNFTDNTFETSGTQNVGITGWQNGGSTVVGNVGTWTGSGSDPTTLANLQGYGSVYATADVGKVVTGSSLSLSGFGGGNSASVSVGTSGVALPGLSAVTAATTTALATTNTGNPVETALKAAVATGSAHLTDSAYSVNAPIVINLTNAGQGPINIDFGGAKIQSNIANGSPVIEIIVGAGVNVSQLTLSHLLINGNGGEGDGIKIIADGTDRSIKNLSLDSVNIEHVGGIGLDVIGNVHGTILNSWMNGNNGGGARFANGPNGGVADGLSWIGGGFRKNPVAGLILDNGTKDMTVKGAYFVENVGVGIDATSGITLVKESGFENNGGTAIVTNGSANIVSDTFSTWGAQKVAVGGYLSGGTVNMSGIDKEYYGSGSDTTLLANLQGSGTLAVAGAGAVIAGPGITVTGSTLSASSTSGVSSGGTGGGTSTAIGPVVTEKLVSDTGSSASDGITSSATLSGTADPNSTVKFTVDGTAITATATADSSGKWSYTPTVLSDGQHTIVASQTNAAGQTGSTTLTFTLDTKTPVLTEALAGGGTSTSTGALTGTADPNAVVKFTVDGTQIAGTATADATGKWAYTPGGLAAGTHTVVATSTDVAGNTGSASVTFSLSTATGGTSGSGTTATTPVFTGGTFANGQITVTGTTPVAGETVWIYDGNNWAGAVTSDASGKFSFTEAAVAGSTHSFGAIATDSAGTTTKTTTAFVHTASTTTPVPAVPTVTAALSSDTGASASDQITSVAALSGTADPNATVKFAVDGAAATTTATADASGKWSFTPTGLSDGQHSIVASETNTGGTGSASVSFTLDTAAPTVTSKLASDTGASATDKITSNATISGTAAANSTVKFTVDGSATSTTATADASGNWSFTPTGLADGQHTVVASQTDVAGNIGSTSLTFTLDTVAGTVTPKLAVDSGASATDKITSNAALTGTAAPNAVVSFTIDGTPVAATATADASGNWSFTPTGLRDGQHTVAATQTDPAGNTSTDSLSFTLDSTAPVVTGTVANGSLTSLTSLTSLASTSTTMPTVTGTADPNGTVSVSVDGATGGMAATDGTGTWSYTPNGLSAGAHTVVASQTDLAGNTGSAAVSVSVAGLPPTVTEKLSYDTGSSATDTITSNGAITGTADPGSVVHFTIDGTPVSATATANASGVWSFAPAGLADGTHTIVASETNAGGATGSASLAFTLDTKGVAPVFTGGTWANGQLTVTGTTGGNETVWIYDGSNWAGAVTSDASGKFSFTEAAASGSTHSFGAIATDLAGNTGKTAAPFAYTAAVSVTTPPPTGTNGLPVVTEKLVSDTGASATDGITSNAALTGTADANATVHFTIDGTPIAATATASGSGVWSYTPTGLSDGFHTVVASETNAAGATGAATLGFTYDTHAPIPSFTGESVSSNKVTITGTTGEAGDIVSICDGSSWAGTATTGADGTFSFTAKATGGVHTYGANATGPAGEGHGTSTALLGSSAADTLVGTAGNDVIVGNGGNDVITGGLGADKLTGGTGNVTFTYTAAAQSTSAAADTITDFQHGADKIDFTAIAGLNASNGTPTFQGYLTGTGSQTLNAHSVAVMEVGGNTQVLVNTSDIAQTVTPTDTHAADMKISLVGVNLGITGNDFHHN